MSWSKSIHGSFASFLALRSSCSRADFTINKLVWHYPDFTQAGYTTCRRTRAKCSGKLCYERTPWRGTWQLVNSSQVLNTRSSAEFNSLARDSVRSSVVAHCWNVICTQLLLNLEFNVTWKTYFGTANVIHRHNCLKGKLFKGVHDCWIFKMPTFSQPITWCFPVFLLWSRG